MDQHSALIRKTSDTALGSSFKSVENQRLSWLDSWITRRMHGNRKLNTDGPIIQIMRYGEQESTVVIVDDFLRSAAPFIEDAAAGRPFESGSLYPGINIRARKEFVLAVYRIIKRLVAAHYAFTPGDKLVLREAFYALVTRPPEDLLDRQCLPHVDDVLEHGLAALLYLNPGPFGGTSFYRHVPTGLERLTQNNVARYEESVANRFGSESLSRGYYRGEGDYERIGRIEYRVNRLVLYPSSLLHSGDIESDVDISDDPRTGRLTLNFFLNVVPKVSTAFNTR